MIEPIIIADGIRAAAYNADPNTFLADVSDDPGKDHAEKIVRLAHHREDEARMTAEWCSTTGGIAVEALPHLVRIIELFRSISAATFHGGESAQELDAEVRRALSGSDRADARALIEIGDKVQASTIATPQAGDAPSRRRGRLTKPESEAKRMQLLAIIRQHQTLKDDPAELARLVDVSKSTVRRWLELEEQQYRDGRSLHPNHDD